MSKKKVHPADAQAAAGIAAAVSFAVHLFRDGETHRVEGIETLEAARAKATEMAAGASRRPGVYAITADGAAHLVPPSYKLGAFTIEPADKPAKTLKKAAKSAKAKKTAKPKKAAAKPGASKTEIAIKLLTRPQGATRKEVTEATEWPSINLKPIAKRHKMKLVAKEGVLRMVGA